MRSHTIGLLAAIGLMAIAGIVGRAQAQDTAAARTAALERCADGRKGIDTRVYCTAYADFMIHMTPAQQRVFDQALRECGSTAPVGTLKWACEERAYDAARSTGSAVAVVPRMSATTALPTAPVLAGDALAARLASPPPGPIGIDPGFMAERRADRQAAFTLRVPITYAGLPAVDELKQFMREGEIIDGQPQLAVVCSLTLPFDGHSLRAVTSVPWVENGAERREVVSLRFFERFGNGWPASRAGQYLCHKSFGVLRGDGSLRLVELTVVPSGKGSALCWLVPGHEVGRDDSCAVVSGSLERARLGRSFRQWFGTPPPGLTGDLEVLPAPAAP